MMESEPGQRSAASASSKRSFVFATLMTTAAGFVDAVGFVQLGQLYLSFMSGNSTRFGVAVAQLDGDVIRGGASVIFMFVVGAFVGTLVADAAGRLKVACVLAAEVALFAVAIVLTLRGLGAAALMPIAVAMGMQNTVHQIVSGADIGRSFVTGALFSLGQSLAQALKRRAVSPIEWAVYAASWSSFVVGVVIGSLALSHFGVVPALAAVAAVLSALALAAFFRR